MNFYKRFVADIQVKTGHLTPAEFGIYDRLLDHYYATEALLPGFERCCAIARCMTRSDKDALRRVLGEFFIAEEGDAYSQRRADEMIAEAQPKIEAARKNGKRGGRPKKPKPETEQKPTGFQTDNPTGTQAEPNAKASQNQNKKRGDTPLKPPAAWSPPDWVPAKAWGDFETMRKAMRGVPFTDAARDGVVRELDKLRAQHDPEALLQTAVMNSWRTVYPPKVTPLRVRDEESIRAANAAANAEAKRLLGIGEAHA